MEWRRAQPGDAAGIRRLLLTPNITKLTTLAGMGEDAATFAAVRAVSLDASLVLDDNGVSAWLGCVPCGCVSEVSGVMDVARYGVFRSITLARAGLLALNPLLDGFPFAVVDERNLFARRCLQGMGILIKPAYGVLPARAPKDTTDGTRSYCSQDQRGRGKEEDHAVGVHGAGACPPCEPQ